MPPKEDPLWQVTYHHQHPQDPSRSGYLSKLRSNANISHKFERPFPDLGLIAQIRFRHLGIGQSSVTGTFGVTGPAIQRTNTRDFLKRVDSLEALKGIGVAPTVMGIPLHQDKNGIYTTSLMRRWNYIISRKPSCHSTELWFGTPRTAAVKSKTKLFIHAAREKIGFYV